MVHLTTKGVADLGQKLTKRVTTAVTSGDINNMTITVTSLLVVLKLLATLIS